MKAIICIQYVFHRYEVRSEFHDTSREFIDIDGKNGEELLLKAEEILNKKDGKFAAQILVKEGRQHKRKGVVKEYYIPRYEKTDIWRAISERMVWQKLEKTSYNSQTPCYEYERFI